VALLVEKEQADKAKVQEELQQHLAEAQADVSCCCICQLCDSLRTQDWHWLAFTSCVFVLKLLTH